MLRLVFVLFALNCATPQVDTAILENKADSVREAKQDYEKCTEVKGHDDCKEYHDRYDKKINEFLNQAVKVSKDKDTYIQTTEKKIESDKKYTNLGKTIVYGLIAAAVCVGLYFLGRLVWPALKVWLKTQGILL